MLARDLHRGLRRAPRGRPGKRFDSWVSGHLFIDGEFMSRARLLSGLTVEQVSVRPPGLPHTIYEELWHTTKWQSIVVQCDEPAAAAWIDGGQDFPSEAPGNERMWEDLVTEFLAGSETAVELGR